MPYRRKKLTFAISSPDEFLSKLTIKLNIPNMMMKAVYVPWNQLMKLPEHCVRLVRLVVKWSR